MARRRQLLEMLGAERSRLRLSGPALRPRLEAHIEWLEREPKETDQRLCEQVQESPIWRAKEERLRSVPGVGPILSATLLAEFPELGRLNGKKAAALAGVAPFNRDSGKWRGRRRIWGGRASLRSAPYMAALAGSRCNPVIRAFYEKLKAEAKPFKVALTACMHKLLVTLNSMAHHGTAWNTDLAVPH